jgi:hypothetical protein
MRGGDEAENEIAAGQELQRKAQSTTLTPVTPVYDQSNSNQSMAVFTTNDPLRGIMNTIAHYFSTGLIFMYSFIITASSAWMYLVTVVFEQTDFLATIQVQSVNLMFSPLQFIVPLFINSWAASAEATFSATTTTFAQTMETNADLSFALLAIVRASPESTLAQSQRRQIVMRSLQYVKLLHYLNYAIFVNHRVDIVINESRANLALIPADVRASLLEAHKRGGTALMREILMEMTVALLTARHSDLISYPEYKSVRSVVEVAQMRASRLAAGDMPSKDKLLNNHKFLVLAVYLGVVLPITFYNDVGVYAALFYGVMIMLLISPILIPQWLTSALYGNRRFRDVDFINKRRSVYATIKTIEARVLAS